VRSGRFIGDQIAPTPDYAKLVEAVGAARRLRSALRRRAR
jgi:hypothetical protein